LERINRCLFDVVNADGRDGSIRPNQVLAVSLFHTMLSNKRAKSVVTAVDKHLLTPYGLRSLAPSDHEYRGRYEGHPYMRDGAYHQGTVWPWFMGPFLTAYLKVSGRSARARKQAEQKLSELRRFMLDEALARFRRCSTAMRHIGPAAVSHRHGVLRNYSPFPWRTLG
jgi:glycogen debranching enzyme